MRDFIYITREMWRDGPVMKGVMILLAVCLLMLPISIYMENADAQEFKRYAAEHDCRKTGKTDVTLISTPVFDGKGHVVTFVQSAMIKYEYACGNNEILWR